MNARPRDEVKLRVEHRAGRYRVIDATTGIIARDAQGEAIDLGGFQRRSQAERMARMVEAEVRHRIRTGARPSDVETTESTSEEPTPLEVTAVDRDRGIIVMGTPETVNMIRETRWRGRRTAGGMVDLVQDTGLDGFYLAGPAGARPF